MNVKRQQGFTIVELLIVIIVMAILLSISTLAYVSVQKSSRDGSKEAKAKAIAFALEAYHDKNNEYPSVASIAGQPQTNAATKLDLTDKGILEFPGATIGSNALVSASPSKSQLLYEGVTTDTGATSQCQSSTTGYCDAFKLTYIKEIDNSTNTINSRRSGFDAIVAANNAAPDPPSQPTVYGQKISSSVVRFTAGNATCASGNVEYKIRYSTSSTMPDWSNYSWMTGTTTDINPGSNTTYYSQSMARCNTGSQQSGSSVSSVDYIDFTPPPPATPPATPSVSASGVSTSAIQVYWSSPSGATYYNVRYGTSSANTSASCGSSPCTISGLASSTYYYVSVAACNSDGCSSPGTSGASTQTPQPTGTAPGTPSVNASMGYDTAQVSWSGVSGTTPISYTVRYGAGSANTTASCSSSPCNIGGLSMSTNYAFTVTASNSFGSSTGSTSGTTLSPSLSFTGASPTDARGNNASASWTFTPSSFNSGKTFSLSVRNSVTGAVSNYSTTGTSYGFSLDPCKAGASMTLSSAGYSTTGNVPAFGSGTSINVNGSSKTGDGKAVNVNWNYGGATTWISIQIQKQGSGGGFSEYSVADNISETSAPWRSPNLANGTYRFRIAANNCRYRGAWTNQRQANPSYYDVAPEDTSSNFTFN